MFETLCKKSVFQVLYDISKHILQHFSAFYLLIDSFHTLIKHTSVHLAKIFYI